MTRKPSALMQWYCPELRSIAPDRVPLALAHARSTQFRAQERLLLVAAVTLVLVAIGITVWGSGLTLGDVGVEPLGGSLVITAAIIGMFAYSSRLRRGARAYLSQRPSSRKKRARHRRQR